MGIVEDKLKNSPFRACAEELHRVLAKEPPMMKLMTLHIADKVQAIADAKTAPEQERKIAELEDAYKGYLHSASPNMDEARAVLQRHGVIPTP